MYYMVGVAAPRSRTSSRTSTSPRVTTGGSTKRQQKHAAELTMRSSRLLDIAVDFSRRQFIDSQKAFSSDLLVSGSLILNACVIDTISRSFSYCSPDSCPPHFQELDYITKTQDKKCGTPVRPTGLTRHLLPIPCIPSAQWLQCRIIFFRIFIYEFPDVIVVLNSSEYPSTKLKLSMQSASNSLASINFLNANSTQLSTFKV